ncbi:MAG: UDP-3-O-(3-hydroxymyristoyl)glucosamine N-acyltransferase [Thermodesulfovibrionales bacterium]|nr:UDP-3-O-(3-hydroxymyristoyl)glucosamine N-acyltransferase [Thermodesulfovibrionales bacterium]
MKLKDIAALINGEVIGDSEIEITGVSSISDAKEGDITYIVSTKWLKGLEESKASAVIVKEPFEGIKKTQVVTSNPQYAFAQLLNSFYVKPHPCQGVSERAFVSDNAQVAPDATIYPFAYISAGVKIGSKTIVYPGVFIGENTEVGDNCIIYPNVTIREGTMIKNRIIIHAGAVIGSDGFGYVFEGNMHYKIPQIGNVIIEDDVEIGANVTIDRATTGCTLVGRGTKIDNLVQIGHNVNVGKNVILVAQVGIGGSSMIGDSVMLAGQVGVSDHADIAAGAIVGAQAGAMGKISKGIYFGSPAKPYKQFLKCYELFLRLPEMEKQIKGLQKKLEELVK